MRYVILVLVMLFTLFSPLPAEAGSDSRVPGVQRQVEHLSRRLIALESRVVQLEAALGKKLFTMDQTIAIMRLMPGRYTSDFVNQMMTQYPGRYEFTTMMQAANLVSDQYWEGLRLSNEMAPVNLSVPQLADILRKEGIAYEVYAVAFLGREYPYQWNRENMKKAVELLYNEKGGIK